jgi:hypothetical protein
VTDLSDDALDRIEQAFRNCRADHAECTHDIAGYQLVQDFGPALVQEVRKLRGSFSALDTLPRGVSAQRIAEQIQQREKDQAGPSDKTRK